MSTTISRSDFELVDEAEDTESFELACHVAIGRVAARGDAV